MARYRIGQLVRIVQSDHNQHLIGSAAMITQVMGPMPDLDRGGTRFGYGLDISPIKRTPFGYVLSWADFQLEPILPEGMQPVSWSECLWQPEGERVS